MRLARWATVLVLLAGASSVSAAPRVKWLPFSRLSFIGWARASTLRSRKIRSGGV